MRNSTAQHAAGKLPRPKKPYADFPLSPHASGAWQKKIRGKIFYFGRWGRIRKGVMERLPDDGWQHALELYKSQADDLHSGRTPRVKSAEGITLAELCNRFLTAKARKLKAGEITAATFANYRTTTDMLISQLGQQRLVDDLASDDFGALRATMAERWGPARLTTEITKTRSVFKFGYDAGLILNAVRFGPEFTKPSASVLRRHRAKNGQKMLEAPEIHRLLEVADVQLRAMLLLGVNCGFNNSDCANLPLDKLDLEGGWIDYPRPKTGIPRRCPLWPETTAALREWTPLRPKPKQAAAEGLVFITTRGRAWLQGGQANPVCVAVCDLMKAVGVHRAGIGFGVLRHVFRTIADEKLDQVAINRIMGHAMVGMGAIYTERVDDSRLVAVTEHVRRWLFGVEGGA